MATSSFKNPLRIDTDESADAMIEAMENPRGKNRKRGNFDEMVKRGIIFLEKKS